MRGDTGKFRCDECRKVLDLEEDGGFDCGASHWFCWLCQEKLENREAVIEARIERKHGVVLSSNSIHFLAHYAHT